jgi:hypothetical protein
MPFIVAASTFKSPFALTTRFAVLAQARQHVV